MVALLDAIHEAEIAVRNAWLNAGEADEAVLDRVGDLLDEAYLTAGHGL